MLLRKLVFLIIHYAVNIFNEMLQYILKYVSESV